MIFNRGSTFNREYQFSTVAQLIAPISYDPETGLYFNSTDRSKEKSVGMMFSFTPNNAPVFHAQLRSLGRSLYDGVTVQFLSFRSPEIRFTLDRHKSAQVNPSDLNSLLQESQRKLFFEKRYNSGDNPPIPVYTSQNFATIYFEFERPITDSKLQQFTDLCEKFKSALGETCSIVSPEELIHFLRVLMHAEGVEEHPTPYDKKTPINSQIEGAALERRADSLHFAGSPLQQARTSMVSQFPAEWDPSNTLCVFGNTREPETAPLGPVLVTQTIRCEDQASARNSFQAKIVSGEHAKKGSLMTMSVPDYSGKVAEVKEVSQRLDKGETFVSTLMTVVAYGPGHVNAELVEARALAPFIANGFEFKTPQLIQLPFYLTALPFSPNRVAFKATALLNLVRHLPSDSAMALAPVCTEWHGNSRDGQGMLLTSRLGNVTTFDPFQSGGNFNISVIGSSGSGKSFWMTSLLHAVVTQGHRAIVIDDGRSFERTCEALDGDFFDLDLRRTDLSLNPFSLFGDLASLNDEDKMAAINSIHSILCTIADINPQDGNEIQNVLRDKMMATLRFIIENHSDKCSISFFLEMFGEQHQDELETCSNLQAKFNEFLPEGLFARFFTRPASITIDSKLAVFELQKIREYGKLLPVVVQCLMAVAQAIAFKRDVSHQRTYIVVDEAATMLADTGTSIFLEKAVRTLRKYNGSLVVATQSYADFQGTPGAAVAWQNSNTRIFLSGSHSDLPADFPPGVAAEIESLSVQMGCYGEFVLQIGGAYAACRLVVSDVAQAMFMTDAERNARLKQIRQNDPDLTLPAALVKLLEQERV